MAEQTGAPPSDKIAGSQIDVFVVGALHLDVVVDAPHLPARDETVMGTGVAYRFGGKGGNQAVAAARMGARAEMAGRVGRDRFGAALLDALDAAGVRRRQVRQGPGATGMSAAIVEHGGDYGAVIVSGVNAEIAARDIVLPQGPYVLLLQSEVPEAVNLKLAHAIADDVTLVLNAAPARPLPAALLRRADVLVVNRLEAAMLTDAAMPPDEAAAALLALGPRAVIVTLGADGLVGATRENGPFAAPAVKVPVISTHGAGDAFTGALAAELCRCVPLQAAAAFGQAAAALTVSTAPDARDTIDAAMVRALMDQSAMA